MKSLSLLGFFTLCWLIGPTSSHAQANLFDHLFWQAYGTHDGREWGGTGLDTIGYVNDSIRHAVTIAEAGGAPGGASVSSYVYLRTKLDTARHYEFPGQKVIPGDFNGDGKMDFCCWDAAKKRIVVLGRGESDFQFDTLLVLQGTEDYLTFLQNSICVADVDSDGKDDLVVSDQRYLSHDTVNIGRVALYRGSVKMDTTPSDALVGTGYPNQAGGYIGVGNVRGGTTRYLCELRYYGNTRFARYDTTKLFLYPLGPHFRLVPADSIILTFDSARFGPYLFGFALIDVDGDGTDDIVLTAVDNNFRPDIKVDAVVLCYKGGASIVSMPQWMFHCSSQFATNQFGTQILDVGSTTGRGYPSLLVTDPIENTNDAGAVFLYNMGAALKDSCVAWAQGESGSNDALGSSAIGPGDLTADGKSEIMIGGKIDDRLGPTRGERLGNVNVFFGDSSYGPFISAVHDRPQLPHGLRLLQNYPNPFASATDVTFSVADAALHGAEVTLKLYDALGRACATLYRGTADGYQYTIRMDASRLPPGTYVCVLRCGGTEKCVTMEVVR